jgi:hypothetical protein
MSVDIIQLIGKFKNIDDVETPHAFFKTKVPSVAPEAYLNIIYKAADSGLITELSAQMEFPTPIINFFKQFNGARLFVNTLNIYGCIPEGMPVERSNLLKIMPFDLRGVNKEFCDRMIDNNLLVIASYGFDRSLVCIDRVTTKIICFVGKDFSKERMRWPSFDEWLNSEVQRIAFFFDQDGNRLIEKEKMLPSLAFIN